MKRFGVAPNDIDAILISHVHGDHFGGIPFFILDAQFLSKRERPLLIAGPPGIEARVRAAQEALFANSSKTEQKFEIRFSEWQDRVPDEIAGVTVTPFEVVHGSGAPPFALRLEVDGRTIAYSGDTEWTPALVDVSRDADLFICEANFYREGDEVPPGLPDPDEPPRRAVLQAPDPHAHELGDDRSRGHA